MQDPNDNYKKIMMFIMFLYVGSLCTGISCFIVYLFSTMVVVKYQMLGFSLAMFLIFLSITTFIKSMIPKDMDEELNKMLDEEAERKAQEIIDKIFGPDKNKKEEK